MPKARFNQAVRDELTKCVNEIEQHSAAEVVIAVRARSGSYAHADYLFASSVAFLSLLFILFSPWSFHAAWVAIDVAVVFLLAFVVSRRSDSIRRLVTPRTDREAAARTHAAAMFYEAGIANTAAETGLIVYVSILERRAEIFADRGILEVVPPQEWNESLGELRVAGEEADPTKLIAALRKLGKLLAEHLPATSDDKNELSDAPHFDLE